MKWYYPFSTKESPLLREVGGKGLSLILMTQRGLPVPRGLILTMAFFEPWLEEVSADAAWARIAAGSLGSLKEDAALLKTLAGSFELDDARRSALEEALSAIGAGPFAVRSSSPEEDLEGASFAGGYETVLGVTRAQLERALRRAFASCLDERVILYKREHGFSIARPSIAVIIQEQIASEVAGVAFSINPLDNSYDEAVINASFGLGESVVAGKVSPDSFVVDKASLRVIEQKIGSKETAIWLKKDGGTFEEPSPRRAEPSLGKEQIIELVRMLLEVERAYAKPMDIEWAYAGGELHLLQARPITAFVPLPEEMQTRPGEPKRLYLDFTLAKQGIQELVSPMGLELITRIQQAMFEDMLGTREVVGVADGMFFALGGRLYANLSYLLKLPGGKKRQVLAQRAHDTLTADILDALDEREYVAMDLPPSLEHFALRMALHNTEAIRRTISAIIDPLRYHAFFREETKKLADDFVSLERQDLSIESLLERAARRYVHYVNHISLPVTYAAEFARARLKRIFRDAPSELRDKVVFLEQALPHNVTIEMGLAMHSLSRAQEIHEITSVEAFCSRLRERALSPEFLSRWDEFMHAYGHRCPKEMDIAAPRFYETPERVFRQLRAMAESEDEASTPQAIFERGVSERQRVSEFLRRAARERGWFHEKRFEKSNIILSEFGGYREIHKYYLIKIIDMIRRRVLSAARTLREDGRLDHDTQVFDLSFSELAVGMADRSLDLRARAAHNTRFNRKLERVRDLPRLIDSRGRILRPPRKVAGEGELVGEPISPGVVRGRVKILHRPDEKPVLRGEILVARATDPGWTPLFLNAGGIILEVGGLLQHGALVAREYCKPCVAGLEGATGLFEDGDEVEVDGASGIIRRLSA